MGVGFYGADLSQNNFNQEWIEAAVIEQAHSGPVWKLDWGHPEYGSVLVSCGEDRGVYVWMERSGPVSVESGNTDNFNFDSTSGVGEVKRDRWKR